MSGKQLVFLVMAATTVLAVSFMLGMLVGRGVRAEREEAVNIEAAQETPPTPERRPVPDAQSNSALQAQAPPEPVSEEPPVAIERGTAASKAGKDTPAAKPADAPAPKAAEAQPAKATDKPPAKPAEKPVVQATPANDKPSQPQAPTQAAKPTPTTVATARTQPPMPPAAPNGSGYAVQVAAVNERSEADAIVKRLSGKGYAAYVESPKGGASVYRVRVGTFQSRSDALTVADRLTKEERFKPWVTR